MASLIHDTSPTLRHGLQQSHNKGLYYGFRDAILSYFTIVQTSKLATCMANIIIDIRDYDIVQLDNK